MGLVIWNKRGISRISEWKKKLFLLDINTKIPLLDQQQYIEANTARARSHTHTHTHMHTHVHTHTPAHKLHDTQTLNNYDKRMHKNPIGDKSRRLYKVYVP